jgi:hypothetical protein
MKLTVNTILFVEGKMRHVATVLNLNNVALFDGDNLRSARVRYISYFLWR